MITVEDVLIRQRTFARERDWEQFHSPKNLAMALGGEIGELCVEIEPLLVKPHFPLTSELEGVGHEVADVALYLIRLYDVVRADLPSGFSHSSRGDSSAANSVSVSSLDLARAVCQLSGAAGLVLETFQWEDGSSHALPSRVDRDELAIRLHGVWVALDAVAGLLDIDVLVAAGVKIDANEQRYPVASSRGSSRKYTELTGGEG